MANCTDRVVQLLREIFPPNDTALHGGPGGGDKNDSRSIACAKLQNDTRHSLEDGTLLHPVVRVHVFGSYFYGYVTPVIIIVGLIGNIVSLKVFTSKFMLRLSSSCYLATLSACHILILLTYVLLDWLDKGLPQWPGNMHLPLINVEGACHVFLYLSYTFRLASVWLIVAFAIERYIAICRPNRRRAVCARPFAKRVTAAIVLCAGVLCSYKPTLSGVYEVGSGNYRACGRNPHYHNISFMLESIYVIMITAVPSFVISALSIPTFRKLKTREKKSKQQRLVFKENRIRLEFTIVLLAISWCFIALTLPYFVVWSLQFWQSLHPQMPNVADGFRGQLLITRTIFYINYGVNFFLYCITGAHYRREIRSILKLRYHFSSEDSSSSSTQRRYV